ncbi:MAG: hypothetical protein FJZ47_03120 [Candidatus Tectomicrobia bacterium]|uniref:Uncharacterized protein n=1 Tax=Tectimicrobiota bacterium TaxID=2528274 RepID=A0A937VXL6_UNCTE|nr:hypothetical protein [Candidatus Tectomicrobia bacterium]
MSQPVQLLKPWKTLLGYPYTWLALVLVVGAHLAFTWWFQPTSLMQALAFALDVGALPAGAG